MIGPTGTLRPVDVHIRRNADGVVRVCRMESRFDVPDYCDGFADDFLWSEGNFACDCNRAIFFERAAGVENIDRQCGDDAYFVRIVDAETGALLYEDDE